MYVKFDTAADILDWQYCYSIEKALFPSSAPLGEKYWPSVNRVDQVYGDRNLVCSCPPLEIYQDAAE